MKAREGLRRGRIRARLPAFVSFEKIGELPLKEFNKVKELYIKLQKAREEKKNKLVKEFSQEITDIIEFNRKEFLTLTKDPKLVASLAELFKLSN